jgi:DNA-directed RNA polymerase II subunit RPB1
MSADRIGVNKKGKIGPLAKASFEQTEDIMLRAAMFGEMDPVTGVSANIMTGQPIQGGTSFSQVLVDEMALMAYLKEAPATPEQETVVVDFEPLPLAPACDLEDLAIPEMLPPKGEMVEAQPLPDIDVNVTD